MFATPNSKNIIATLRIVTIEKPELATFLYYNSMVKFIIWSQVVKKQRLPENVLNNDNTSIF